MCRPRRLCLNAAGMGVPKLIFYPKSPPQKAHLPARLDLRAPRIAFPDSRFRSASPLRSPNFENVHLCARPF